MKSEIRTDSYSVRLTTLPLHPPSSSHTLDLSHFLFLRAAIAAKSPDLPSPPMFAEEDDDRGLPPPVGGVVVDSGTPFFFSRAAVIEARNPPRGSSLAGVVVVDAAVVVDEGVGATVDEDVAAG